MIIKGKIKTMKTEQEIKEKLEWLNKAIYNRENQSELVQCKLYSAVDTLNWVLRESKVR